MHAMTLSEAGDALAGPTSPESVDFFSGARCLLTKLNDPGLELKQHYGKIEKTLRTVRAVRFSLNDNCEEDCPLR